MKSIPVEQPLASLLTYWQKVFGVLKVFFLNRKADNGDIRRMAYNEPDFRALHKDPHRAELMDRPGVSKDQYDAIEFDVVLPAGEF